MGIPLFFKYLCKKYPKCIIDLPFFLQHHNLDELYFDLNGLIHPACHRVKQNFPKLGDSLDIEKQIMNETKVDINKIIDLVKPKKYISLSVDGVAPFAKMNQQRERRYKSYIYNKKIQSINKKYDINCLEWDTNMISPGTPFMNKLMTYLDNYVKEFKKKSIKVDLSPSSVPGEGEQKILHKIKQNNDDLANKVIFGLDADLIMLSLISGVSNIYLLRESKVFGQDGHEYLVLDIDQLGEAIYQEVSETYLKLYDKLNYKKTEIIQDYIVLCFLVGNDFLPNLTMLNIDKGAINYLLKIYTQVIYKFSKLLVQDGKINFDILVEIFQYLAQDEDDFLKIFHNNFQKKRYFEPNHLNDYEKTIRKLEYTPLLNNITNNIEYNKKGWRSRYYSRYLKLNNIRQKDIDKMIVLYLEGLQWTLNYYTDKCPSWSWYYSFQCSPSVMDIYKYLRNNQNLEINFIENEPLIAKKQLMCILPRKSLENIPGMEEYLNDLDYMYPLKFHMDMLYKIYHHQCNVFLPKIDYNYIKNY